MSIATQIEALTADKTAIETAITAKGGTLSQSSGFDTFANDIASIPTGSAYDIDDLIDRIIPSIESDVTKIGAYAFCSCTKLKTAQFPNATICDTHAFDGCSVLNSIYLPQTTAISGNAFRSCSKLEKAFIPLVSSIGYATFTGCSVMKFYFPSLSTIPSGAFEHIYGSSSHTFVFGYTSNNAGATLSNTSAFNYTSIAAIYVPPDLISWYQSATNWSSLYANNNNIFKPISTTAFSGDGLITTFTLTDNNAHPDDVFWVKVGNDFFDFDYDNTTGIITLETAPETGTNNINVFFKGGKLHDSG